MTTRMSPKQPAENTVKDPLTTIVIAVAHRQFSEMGIKKIRKLGKDNCVIFDLKYLFDRQLTDVRM